MPDLFAPLTPARPGTSDPEPLATADPGRILAFDITVEGARETPWRDLFEGFSNLKALTVSASVPAILDLASGKKVSGQKGVWNLCSVEPLFCVKEGCGSAGRLEVASH